MRAIVAVCADWGIGFEGKLLVHCRADMRHFVQCTTGGTVIMGRKTLESFPGGRPLKNRRNIVLTHQEMALPEGAERASSVEEALRAVADEDPEHVWAIGGESVYRALLPCCTEAIVTKLDCVCPADAFFPDLDEDPAWELADSTAPEMGPEGVSFSFCTYRHRS